MRVISKMRHVVLLCILAGFSTFVSQGCSSLFNYDNQPGTNPQKGGAGISNLTITSISPNRGPAKVTTPVVISGTGFALGIQVLIGSQPCLNIAIASPTVLFCSVPAEKLGRVNVTLTENGATAELKQAFTYIVNTFPLANVAVGSGGGISKGKGIQMYITIGQSAVNVPVQTAPGIRFLPGIQHVMTDEH